MFCNRFQFLILSILIFGIASTNNADQSPAEILSAADTLEKKLEWVDYRLAMEQWEFDKSGYSDSLSFYNDLYLYLITTTDPLISALVNNSINDRNERQRLQIISAKTLLPKIEQRSVMTSLRDSINSIIDSFKVDFQGEIKSLSDINKIYQTNRSRSQRELAARAWYSIGETLSPKISKLITARNTAASKLGFENYWELVSFQFSQNGIELVSFVKTVDSLTQAANAAILEGIRTNLGVNQIELWDVPFSFTQITDRANNFFPADSQLPMLRRSLSGLGFNLEKLPIFFQQSANSRFVPFASTYSVKAPHDVRVLTNLQDGYSSLNSLFYNAGVSLFSVYIAQERPLYNFATDMVWQMAMGEILSAMVNDSAWLNNIAGVPVGFISQYRQARFEQQILHLRVLLADIIFVREAHIDPDRDLNKLYWEIFQKYTGLPKHEDIIMWSTLPELANDPMLPAKELLSKAIAAQSVNYMTTYFGPFVNNLNTSSFLIQNYYRFGSRYAWSELLQRGTGEKLSPVHLKKLF